MPNGRLAQKCFDRFGLVKEEDLKKNDEEIEKEIHDMDEDEGKIPNDGDSAGEDGLDNTLIVLDDRDFDESLYVDQFTDTLMVLPESKLQLKKHQEPIDHNKMTPLDHVKFAKRNLLELEFP